jgi:hypothetical protein
MKIKNVQRIIFLVFFFLFLNQAWAANWIYIDKAAVGDVYYGKNSIKKVDKSIILVWNKVVLSKEAKTKYFSILKGIHKEPQNLSMLSYYKKLIEIDCVNRKIKDNVITFYDEKGKVVYASPKSESGEWNDILPNTVGEKLINIVSCEAVTPSVTQNEAAVAPNIEEPVTPAADAKAKEPDTVTVTAAPVENAAPVAAPVVTAAPIETAAPATSGTPVEAAAPAASDTPVETAAPVVAPAVPVETAAPVEKDAPVAAPEPVETAAPAAAAAPVAAPEPLETVAPIAPALAVTDKNLAQDNNKQIETKSVSEEAVRNLLTKWLNSWKSGDMKTYRSCYESNFKSEVTYANASVSYKTNVRQKSKKINISVDKLQISADENMATAVFTQYYSSSILKYSGKKKLELRKINDEWKIYREIM